MSAQTANRRLLRWPKEWAESKRISERSAQRLAARGEGPVLTHISERLKAVTPENDAKWEASRERKPAKAQAEARIA